MTKEEALQQIEEYKKPLDRSTATFGNIVDDYYTTSEVLEITRNQIVSSLRKKGLPLAEGAKLSEVPPEILKLPTLEKKLEIVPPNPGAVIDKFDGEFNVTNINANYSPSGKYFATASSYNSRFTAYTDNYVSWGVNSREIYFKRYDDTDNLFKKFTTPVYDTNNFCSAYDGDYVYSFNHGGSTNVMNMNVYDLSGTDFTAPKETYRIVDCYSIVWCDTIDGVVHMIYRDSISSSFYFGTYIPGNTFITQKTRASGAPTTVTYDDKYFYLSYSNRSVYYTSRDLSSKDLSMIELSVAQSTTCIVPLGDKLIVNYGPSGTYLFTGIDSPNPGTRLTSLISDTTNYSVVLDDTHFIASYNTIPYARLLRVVESSGSYSTELVGTFYDINASTMMYSDMVIAKDLLGKQYFVFTRYRNILIEGINTEYEFDLERRV